MASWQQFEDEASELAASVRARFAATGHHVLATLRRDGSPRVSGTEVRFHRAHLVLGSMWGAVKARDLRRDGRFAIHANPGDGSMVHGDAKVSGVAVEVLDPRELQPYIEEFPPPSAQFHLFRLELSEAVLTSVDAGGEFLLIQTWRPGQPLSRAERR